MPTCSPKWATPRTPERKTLGTAAAKIAATLGTPFMPWQKQVADTALEIDERTGRLAFREVRVTVPRQSGKTTAVLSVVLTRALGSPRQSIKYTAQTGSDARKKWTDDWLPMLDKSPFRPLYRERLTNGHEALLFRNGSIQSLIAATKKTGHGSTNDLGILDEAFAHPDARLEQALKPTMITRPQPQLWIVSTAGTPEDSPYLWDKVESGRELASAAVTSGVCYFEWSADDDTDPSDEATWWSCMPALGHTQTVEAIRSDFDSMPLNEFERAYLNRWKTAMSDPVIPLALWAELADRDSKPVDPVCFAFDIPPDRSSASICVAGRRSDGLAHIEVVAAAPGTGWVVDRVEQLIASHKPVAVICDASSPAGGLLPEMARRRIEPVLVNTKEQAQACGMLYDAAFQATIRHLGTPDLTAALDGARKRNFGDAWAWARRSSSVDISPLVGCTLALWGLETQTKRKSRIGVLNLNDLD